MGEVINKLILYSHGVINILLTTKYSGMPYRRLPNTDTARIKAMKIALEKSRELPPHKLAFSSKTSVRIRRFLPLFEHNIHLQRESAVMQNRKNKDYSESFRKARIYLTHFLRVMNMAIYRGDLPAETRAFYGLATNESTIPSLNTENELLSWGKRIIEGEEYRIRKGGSPITNPTIAVVKVRFGHFTDAYNNYSVQRKKRLDYSEKTAGLRKEADEIILDLWNEVESTMSSFAEEKRRQECEDYGIVYFFRKSELDSSSPAVTGKESWS